MTPPEKLTNQHILDLFQSGEPDLDNWLKAHALRNAQQHASQTFVIVDNVRVIGYYALAAGSLLHEHAPRSLRQNMPKPLPVMVLGRLAVDQQYQKQGIGAALLKDAVLRTIRLAEDAGICCMLVHTISSAAKAFYLRYGFVESRTDPATLYLSTNNALKTVSTI